MTTAIRGLDEFENVRGIGIDEIGPILIGQTEDKEAGTGCTVSMPSLLEMWPQIAILWGYWLPM